jgi:hypothetical protein
MTIGTGMSVQPTSRPDAAKRAALLAALDVVQGGTEERFERVTRIAREAFGVSGSFLNLANEDHLVIKSQQSDEVFSGPIPLQDTFCGRTMGEQGAVLVPDALVDERFRDLPMVTGDPNVRFYAGVPLRLGAEAVKVGTLCLIDQQPRTLSPDDVVLLHELGTWAERELAAGADEDRLRSVLTGLEPDPVDVPGYLVDGMSVPHGVVSGDFHDWHRSGDALVVTVSDVMGKGMSAGLLGAGIPSSAGPSRSPRSSTGASTRRPGTSTSSTLDTVSCCSSTPTAPRPSTGRSTCRSGCTPPDCPGPPGPWCSSRATPSSWSVTARSSCGTPRSRRSRVSAGSTGERPTPRPSWSASGPVPAPTTRGTT